MRALGAPVERADEASDALEWLRAQQRRRMIEPTLVAWDGRLPEVELRLPSSAAGDSAQVELSGPAGELLRAAGAPLRARPDPRCERKALVAVAAAEAPLATGVWELRVEAGGRAARSTILSAPSRLPPGRGHLGAFLPVHAMRRQSQDPGAGTMGDLRRLMTWAAACGCDLFGALPLLPTFLEPPAEPSPYAAATRLLPSELFVDLADAGLGDLGANVRRALDAEGPRSGGPPGLVEYETVWARQFRLLRALAADVSAGDRLRGDLDRFARQNPLAAEYATFRARAARLGRNWETWPAAIEPDADERLAAEAFLCGQWLAARQLADLDAEGRRVGCRLYADWPVGVHGRSFDVWRFRELFAEGVSVGAPPDDFSEAGQNWGFPPLLPEVSRADGHAYFRRSLALQFAAAGAVRIDHVMGLHRLLWIPEGATAAEGAYVRYPVDEMYACVMIAAAQHGAIVIGENLGCVPPEVNRTLRQRGFLAMRVTQFELGAQTLAPVGPGEAAMVNTHDTPTFAGFVCGQDIEAGQRLGRFEQRAAAGLRAGRAEALARLRAQLGLPEGAGPAALIEALLLRLAMSDASCLIVNLEDLWLEPLPQNTPGDSGEMPNWRRRAARTVEEIETDEKIAELLRMLAAARAAQGGA